MTSGWKPATIWRRADATVHLERSGCGLRRSGEELEQRRLPGAVRADDPEGLARLDREAHVAERLHPLGGRVLTQEGLLQGARALTAKLVRLRNVIRADRRAGHLRAVTMKKNPRRSAMGVPSSARSSPPYFQTNRSWSRNVYGG